jgi:hypothetical protein
VVSIFAKALEVILRPDGKVRQAALEQWDPGLADLVPGNHDPNALANEIGLAASLEPGGSGETHLLINREVDGRLLHATHSTICGNPSLERG